MMKKVSLSTAAALVFFVATASAQYTPQTSKESSSPAAQQGSTPSSSGMQQGAEAKGEKKLKGCIKSENGKYVLEEKNGKKIELTGQDVSAHVGHEVAIHGSSTPGATKGAEEFNVTSVDMIADTCSLGMGKKEKSSSPDQK